jgi:hypothetical protein
MMLVSLAAFFSQALLQRPKWRGADGGGTMKNQITMGVLAVLTAGLVVVTTAAAQDPSAAPLLGSRDLASGFTPDPFALTVSAGGPIDVEKSRLPSGCTGFITERPTLQIHYQAGRFPFIFATEESDGDTVLVVNGPDARWHCNDDSENFDMDSEITFAAPTTGYYDVWVGTYLPGAATVTLLVTERIPEMESGW